MSNFSKVLDHYLRGYRHETMPDGGFEYGSHYYPKLQRHLAHALGLHHRDTAKPPLMRSVDVVAELRQMRTGKARLTKAIEGTLILTQVPSGHDARLSAIKTIREITGLGLKEAKDLVDEVWYQHVNSAIVLANRPDKVDEAAKILRDIGCTVEVQ